MKKKETLNGTEETVMTSKAKLCSWVATVVCLPSIVLSVFAPSALADGREGSRVPRVYDISDLLEDPTGLAGSLGTPAEEFRRALGPAGHRGQSEERTDVASGFWPNVAEAGADGSLRGSDFSYAKVIASTLRNTLGVTEGDGDAVTVAEGRFLICIVDEDQHKTIARFLERLREERLTLIHISTVMVQARSDAKLPDGFGDSPYLLGDEVGGMEGLQASLRAIEGVEIVGVPNLSVFSLQRAMVSMTRQVPYIAGYETHAGVLPKKEDVIVPEIKILNDGIVVDCQAVLVDDNAISLDLKLTSNELLEPVETKETPEGPIALPVLNVRRFNTNLVIPAGGAAVLPAADKGEGVSFVAIFVEKLVPVTERDGGR